MEAWAELATSKQQTSKQQVNLSAGADPTVYEKSSSMDPFRSRLIHTYLATSQSNNERNPDTEVAAFCQSLTRHDHPRNYAHTRFDKHAHTAAQHTPIRSLLIVSGESWLFGKKVEKEDDFRAAKAQLREWVGSSKAQAAWWHAAALLRLVLILQPDPARDIGIQDHTMGMLHEGWCVYIAALTSWAGAFDGSAATRPFAPSPVASTSLDRPITTPGPSSATPGPSATGYPPLMNAIDADAEMRRFLQVTDVEKATDLPAARLKLKGQSRGLLEVVRMRTINGSLGGLLNEASGVLYRLVEGRSGLSRF